MEKMLKRKINQIEFPLLVFFTSRLAIFLLAVVFISLWPIKPQPGFLQAFSRWDGKWYLEIVKNGYWYQGPEIQSPPAFFPLYPLLGKLLTLFGFSPQLSLFLVANIFCLGFFVLFWKLIKEELGEKVANKSLVYYAISPLSFIFSSLYTESLFLFLSVLVFYFLKKARIFRAALIVGLAGATRPVGLLLGLPVILKAWQERKIGGFFRVLVSGLISSSGFLAFSLYCYLKFEKWLLFSELIQRAWHRKTVFPWETVRVYLDYLFVINPQSMFFSVILFDLALIFLFGFLIYWMFKKRLLNIYYRLFVGIYFLLILSQHWEPTFFLATGSVGRYLFVLFPLLGVLGAIGVKKKWVDLLVIFSFASLFGPFALAFFHGFWIE